MRTSCRRLASRSRLISPPPASNQRRKPCSEPASIRWYCSARASSSSIGSDASRPSRSSRRRRPCSGPSAWAKKSNGVVKSARASQRDSCSCAAAKSGSCARSRNALPQMASAVPGQGEELVLVEPDQRRLQQAGEVEVVLRQQREARHRQQVLDGELLAQVQPVDAGHLELLALQLADQRIHERVAPAHQHHEVAFVQQLALARAPLVADQALGMDRDQPRQPLVRRGQHAARRLDGGRVGLDLLGGDQRPELDPAGVLLAAVLVDHLARHGQGRWRPLPRRTPSRPRRARQASSGRRR